MATAAGLIAALHPTLVYAATHVQVAGLGATLLVWTLAWAYRTGATGRPRDAAITGGLLGVLALTDPILSLAMVGIVWAVWHGPRRAGLRQSLRLSSWTIFVALVVIAPWLVRNALVHGEFVAIKSTFGYAFWQGNCKLSEGTDKVRRASIEPILRRGARGIEPERVEPCAVGGAARGGLPGRHRPDEGRLSSARLGLGAGAVAYPVPSVLAELAADPWRYPRLCLRRLRYFVLFDETNPKARVLVYRASHLGLTVLALGGLLLAGPATRKRLMPTIATAMAIAVFHALTIVSARFHIPLEPLDGDLGGSGADAMGGCSVRVALGSAPAPHHVERIRVEDRLLGVERAASAAEASCRCVRACKYGQDEAREQPGHADHDGASPGDGRQREIVGVVVGSQVRPVRNAARTETIGTPAPIAATPPEPTGTRQSR